MAKKIFKFPIVIDDIVEVELPTEAKILSVQEQNGTPCIWVLLDPSAKKFKRHFRIFGTGQPMNDYATGKELTDVEFESLVFIGTFQLHGGSLVFHLFEDISK